MPCAGIWIEKSYFNEKKNKKNEKKKTKNHDNKTKYTLLLFFCYLLSASK